MATLPIAQLPTEPRLASAEVAARFFRGLSDPSRVRILELLFEGEKNVSQLVERTGLAQSGVSTHLGCLRHCGFVTARRDNRFVWYQVTDLRVRELVRLAQAVIAENAQAILGCQIVK